MYSIPVRGWCAAPTGSDALDGAEARSFGCQERPGGRAAAVGRAVGSGCCRLQMPFAGQTPQPPTHTHPFRVGGLQGTPPPPPQTAHSTPHHVEAPSRPSTPTHPLARVRRVCEGHSRNDRMAEAPASPAYALRDVRPPCGWFSEAMTRRTAGSCGPPWGTEVSEGRAVCRCAFCVRRAGGPNANVGGLRGKWGAPKLCNFPQCFAISGLFLVISAMIW